jgi:hypothetical protein
VPFGHHASSKHHARAFCRAVSASPGKVWKVSQIHLHGCAGGGAGDGGGEGEGGGGEGRGTNGGEGNCGGAGGPASNGEEGGDGGDGNGEGGGLGAATHASTSSKASGNTCSVERWHLSPSQHCRAPEQSAPST